MTIRIYLLAVSMAALAVLAVAQDQAPSTPAPQNQQVPNSVDNGTRSVPAPAISAIGGLQNPSGSSDASNLPEIPALLGGIGVSPAFLSEMERSNYLRGGVNVGATYDDNPLLLSSGAVGNASVSIFPNLSVEQTSSRMRWKLGYAGGLTINQRFTNENQGSHSLIFDSQYRLSPHVNLRVAESFSLTTGFFDAGTGVNVGGLGGGNGSLLLPLSTTRSTLTTVETNYHFALNDLIGASGSFYDMHFTNPATDVPPGTQLTNQLTNGQTTSGSAFWLHRIFRGDWGGTTYRFQRISFTGGDTGVHSFLAVDTLSISTRLALTGFVGPQYAVNNGLLPGGTQATQSSDWSLAGGVDGVWRDERTSVSAGYSRNISDGGGIFGAVRLQTIHGSLRREIVPGWTGSVFASHGSNLAILLPSPTSVSSITLTSVGVTAERNVGRSMGLRIGYNHDLEKESGSTPASALNAGRNRVFVTLSYQWAKPLGM
ncbi:MAG: hypothetical protein WAK29_08380 [Terriglobales bacterium]